MIVHKTIPFVKGRDPEEWKIYADTPSLGNDIINFLESYERREKPMSQRIDWYEKYHDKGGFIGAEIDFNDLARELKSSLVSVSHVRGLYRTLIDGYGQMLQLIENGATVEELQVYIIELLKLVKR